MLDAVSDVSIDVASRPDVTIWLPGLPRGKGRHRSRIARKKNGQQFIHNYPDAETSSYEAQLKFAAQKAMRGRRPIDQAMCCRVTAMFPYLASWSPKKRLEMKHHIVKPDGDNLLKCVDAFKGIVWVDDARVSEWVIRKIYDDMPGYLVEVWII